MIYQQVVHNALKKKIDKRPEPTPSYFLESGELLSCIKRKFGASPSQGRKPIFLRLSVPGKAAKGRKAKE